MTSGEIRSRPASSSFARTRGSANASPSPMNQRGRPPSSAGLARGYAARSILLPSGEARDDHDEVLERRFLLVEVAPQPLHRRALQQRRDRTTEKDPNALVEETRSLGGLDRRLIL
jgi:hypothetical protein